MSLKIVQTHKNKKLDENNKWGMRFQKKNEKGEKIERERKRDKKNVPVKPMTERGKKVRWRIEEVEVSKKSKEGNNKKDEFFRKRRRRWKTLKIRDPYHGKSLNTSS